MNLPLALDLQTLVDQETRIRHMITREYIDPTNRSSPIYDGIVSPAEYIASAPRILWILKEPYDGGETCSGGGWSLTDDLLNKDTDRMSRSRAFQPICYIAYGIWANKTWDQMPWLRDSSEVRNCLRKIAFINVSKLPGLKASPWQRISNAYQQYRNLILHQIRVYQPNLVFACDPHANLILKDLQSPATEWFHFGTAAAIPLNSHQRLVWVGHPSQRTKRSAYVNDALAAATSLLATAATY
jgi:hypothetical protein